ncbi:MAG: bifunctional 4-hydroxy-2-oxoglutarate aldolase/2-dehydro-3-deoxy-phosphogluconate aldolase [Solobacterium sp.]|nr:bifunctional 4-hydroxy-2-oxoglutarate aldolase/2-dehydro-3-deoxy-phosphogluconate aldolase [Solobacterium sp.]
MNQTQFIEALENQKVIPVIVLEELEDAIPTANALLKGGISFMEITFRTDCAKEAIACVSKEVSEICVGAGTILNVEDAKRAVEAGASFIVTPGYSKEVVMWCKENDIAVLPGVATPTEIMYAIQDKCNPIKLFPVEELGGPRYCKTMHSVFPALTFIPSGGINDSNYEAYLNTPGIVAVGGSWFASRAMIQQKQFEEITKHAKQISKK